MEDHRSNNSSHQRGANEESVSVLEGGAWLEFEDEVIVDSCGLPHEQVAPVHKQVQA